MINFDSYQLQNCSDKKFREIWFEKLMVGFYLKKNIVYDDNLTLFKVIHPDNYSGGKMEHGKITDLIKRMICM